MGYTHYYYVEPHLDPDMFKKVVRDFKKMLPVFEKLDIQLRDGYGNPDKAPIVTASKIVFNGNEKCGHEERNLGITWPSKKAKGVCMAHTTSAPEDRDTIITQLTGEQESLAVGDSDVEGAWFAGCELNQRTCGGDCSHETFRLERDFKPESWQEPKENGKYFECTKTAYKPYDLAVNCVLIIAKHHLGKQITVHSDGEIEQWQDSMQICQNVLGYGNEFEFDD